MAKSTTLSSSDRDQIIQSLGQAVFEAAVPAAVGRATIAWNNLVHSIFTLFETLSGLSPEAAYKVFFAVRSDKNQREIVQGLVETEVKPVDPEIAAKMKRIFKKIDNAAKVRNDAVHVILIHEANPKKTRLFHDAGSFKGKVGDDLIEDLHKAAMNCMDLAADVYEAHTELLKNKRFKNVGLAREMAKLYMLYRNADKESALSYGALAPDGSV